MGNKRTNLLHALNTCMSTISYRLSNIPLIQGKQVLHWPNEFIDLSKVTYSVNRSVQTPDSEFIALPTIKCYTLDYLGFTDVTVIICPVIQYFVF